MLDPASLQNWIDPSPSPPPLPFGPAPGETNEVDKALDKLAAAIRNAEGGERKSMASYLMGLPSASRTSKILAQLPSSQLMAFLERHRAKPDVIDVLMLSLAAAGAEASQRLWPVKMASWIWPICFMLIGLLLLDYRES